MAVIATSEVDILRSGHLHLPRRGVTDRPLQTSSDTRLSMFMPERTTSTRGSRGSEFPQHSARESRHRIRRTPRLGSVAS
jgi:hypothetical protein